ncbi:hypothetical protein AGMMS49975_28810 [Clostridia bacterium]|nr:hypothetical protein AGMMS49975_28810 [Clostridia bacterium]
MYQYIKDEIKEAQGILESLNYTQIKDVVNVMRGYVMALQSFTGEKLTEQSTA